MKFPDVLMPTTSNFPCPQNKQTNKTTIELGQTRAICSLGSAWGLCHSMTSERIIFDPVTHCPFHGVCGSLKFLK